LPGVYEHLVVGLLAEDAGVGVIELARPQKHNAFDAELWASFPKAVAALGAVDSVRVVVLCAQGPSFCSGIDVRFLADSMARLHAIACPGRLREAFRGYVLGLQAAITCLEGCRWPVVAAIHGACVGGGIDLVTAADIRVAAADATFCVKEVDLAITADLGTLQRLPRIVGHGVAADLALTARTIGAQEAKSIGLVTQVLGGGRAELLAAVVPLARALAAKSPLALLGTKRVLLHTRDSGGGVAAGLEYVATHNAAMLLSDDLTAAMTAKHPTFSKL